jgi:hypothetical protein
VDALHPLALDITCQLLTRASCGSNPDTLTNATTPRVEGSFNGDQFPSFTAGDTPTSTVATLRAVGRQWKFTFGAPGLGEVQHDNSLGNVALRTAVTERGHCNLLKFCLACETGIDVLAPAGLTLLRRVRGARRVHRTLGRNGLHQE